MQLDSKYRQFLNFPHATASSKAELAWVCKPTVSVVLPVYNQAKFLDASIKSTLKQKQKNSLFGNLELIIVNDGSTDSPEKILHKYENKEDITILNQKNAGLANALNRGFKVASGNFLTWTSADNCFNPGALNSLCKFLIANPSIALTYANVELINDRGRSYSKSNYRTQDQLNNKSHILLLPISAETLHNINDNFINSCFMYRAKTALAVGDYSSEYLGFEDYDYWLRISSIGKVAHIDTDKPLYRYRLHENSLTANLHWEDLNKKQTNSIHRARDVLTNPDIFTKNLSHSEISIGRFSHSSLEIFCNSKQFQYFSSPSQTILLPPKIQIPPAFKRARDCCYGAIDKGACENAVMIFAPDNLEGANIGKKNILLETISNLPQICFVLVCRTKEQRLSADSINVSLKKNYNLRIIDLSDRPKESAGSLPEPTGYISSVLHNLSSVDAIFSFKHREWDLQSIYEIQIEANIAAFAGRPLVVLIPGEKTHCLSYKDLKVKDVDSTLFLRSILPMPHLGVFSIPNNLKTTQKLWLKSTLDQIFRSKLELNSLEQFTSSTTTI
jgi:glycosyltransferase involved in cell wall biosynthesis